MANENWKDDPLENTPPVLGSGQFLKDRGYPDPTQAKIKFGLVGLIRSAVEAAKLSQTEVANIVNSYDANVSLRQPDVSRILNGQVKGFSEARLMTVLAALNYDVRITAVPSPGKGQITVQEPAKELVVA